MGSSPITLTNQRDRKNTNMGLDHKLILFDPDTSKVLAEISMRKDYKVHKTLEYLVDKELKALTILSPQDIQALSSIYDLLYPTDSTGPSIKHFLTECKEYKWAFILYWASG